MKHIKHLLAAMSLLPALGTAQTPQDNYVETTTLLDYSGTNTLRSVQYYNGLGYPTVSAGVVGAKGETAYSLTTYDPLGREEKKYLPISTDNSTLYKDPETLRGIVEGEYDAKAFSLTTYDALDRPLSVTTAGSAFASHPSRTAYSANTNADKVIRYRVSQDQLTQDPSLYYPKNSLTKETGKDPDGNTVVTFKDLFGNVVLQRANDGSMNLDTYYVYDDLGRLRFVLPPKCKSAEDIASTGYRYRYDNRGRLVMKTLPGCDSIRYWYDGADRMIGMRDGRLRSVGKYRFFIYDKFDRLVVQGVCKSYPQGGTLKNASFVPYDTSVLGTGYVVPCEFDSVFKSAELEIANYYDGTEFLTKWDRIGQIFWNLGVSSRGYYYLPEQMTGTVAAATNGELVAQAMVYDIRGNVTYSAAHELGGKRVNNETSYNYTNNPLRSKSTVRRKGYDDLTIEAKTGYGNYNKKEADTLTIDYGIAATSVMRYTYNKLGRLSKVTRKSLGTNVASSVSYAYDMRGWMKKITTGSFTEELFYAGGPGKRLYNGNISSLRWKDNTSSTKRGYMFTYDKANRMLDGIYGEGDDLTANVNGYTEKMTYDENGNIETVTRYRKTGSDKCALMDNLAITYSGNQLKVVSETVADNSQTGSFEYKKGKVKNSQYQYKYNRSGSLVADKSRGIAYITYDLNNNPERIYFTNGGVTRYVYSAAGQKLRAVHYTAKPNITSKWGTKPADLTEEQTLSVDSTDYLLGGSLVMKNNMFDKYLFEGGYAQAAEEFNQTAGPKPFSGFEDEDGNYTSTGNNSTVPQPKTTTEFEFYYYNQDHLGNNREVVDASGVVQQVTNYYPFGAPYADATASKGADVQPYKYNGKELDLMHGLNTYDYGARQHDPILARWDRMDPLCEADYGVSPYSYCNNSPINAVDPDGNFTVFINGFKTNPFGSLEGYWGGHAAEFDKYFKQNHNSAEYRDGSLGGLASWFAIAISGETNLSSETRYKYGYEQGRADVIGLLQKLERNSDGTIIEPLILATHSMGGQYGKGYAQAIMDYYNKHKEMFQGFNMYEFDFAPYQADKQKAVKGVKTIQIHDKCDLIATPTLIEGAEGYFGDSNDTGGLRPHFINNTLFWNQVRNLSEGSYRVINGQIVKQ